MAPCECAGSNEANSAVGVDQWEVGYGAGGLVKRQGACPAQCTLAGSTDMDTAERKRLCVTATRGTQACPVPRPLALSNNQPSILFKQQHT